MRERQGTLQFKTHGGFRKGAGRKRLKVGSGVEHRVRSGFNPRHPLHVTVRLCEGLPSLRRKSTFKVVKGALEAGCQRFGMRLGAEVDGGGQGGTCPEPETEGALPYGSHSGKVISGFRDWWIGGILRGGTAVILQLTGRHSFDDRTAPAAGCHRLCQQRCWRSRFQLSGRHALGDRGAPVAGCHRLRQ